ncbi:hypothetical protein ACWFMI_23115 [Nocardiopsis terrae]
MASLRMVLLHRDGHAPPLMKLLHGVRRAGGYLEQADGSVKGLVYAPFVEYVRDHHGLHAQIRPTQEWRKALADAAQRWADHWTE